MFRTLRNLGRTWLGVLVMFAVGLSAAWWGGLSLADTILKQSTACTVKLGPFLDSGDGVTAETNLTIARTDVRVSVNGGDYSQKADTRTCVHDELGEYDCYLSTSDTATLGRLRIMVKETGALPCWRNFFVVPANVYDSLASTDKLQVDATQWAGGATVAGAIPAAAADAAGGLPVSDAGGLDLDTALQEGMFAGGMVWVDSAGTNSTAWPYGTAPFPTTTIANGKTIADANGLRLMHIHGNHTLAAAMEHYTFVNDAHIDVTDIIDINGQSIEHSAFERLVITGATGNAALISDQTRYIDCYLYAHTNIQGWATRCRVESACSICDTGYAVFDECTFGSSIACTLTLQAPTVCDIEDMAGELTLAGMDGGVCSVSMSRGAILTIDNTCTAGTITVTGAGTVTDNSGVGCTVTVQVAEADVVQISGDATAADNAELAFDGTGYGFTNCTMPTVTTLTNWHASVTDWTNDGRLDVILDAIAADVLNLDGDAMRGTDNAALAATALSSATWTAEKAGFIDIAISSRGTGTALDAAGVRTALGLGAANLDTQLGDIPTVAEFEARTLVAADYFVVGDYTAPLDAAGVRTALGLGAANLDTQLGDIPTVAELEARTLVAAAYFDPANDVVARVTLVDTATTVATVADAVVDAFWDELIAGHNAAGSTGKALSDALADTAELQGDWADGGRLDNLLDGTAKPADVNIIIGP